MTYVLGEPLAVGRYRVAVVSRQAVDARTIGRKGVALLCHKEPAFVVVQDGQEIAALDMMGAEVSLAQVQALCLAVEAFG